MLLLSFLFFFFNTSAIPPECQTYLLQEHPCSDLLQALSSNLEDLEPYRTEAMGQYGSSYRIYSIGSRKSG